MSELILSKFFRARENIKERATHAVYARMRARLRAFFILRVPERYVSL